MRRRLTAILLALATVVGGSLTGATPAGATGLSHVCLSNPNQSIRCGVVVPNDRTLTSIQWYIDGSPHENSGSSTTTEFSCTPGQTYTVSYIVYLSPPPPPGGERFTGSMSPRCQGARISNVYAMCSSGGSRLQCSVSYAGGTPPVSIRWTINGDLRTFFNDKWWLDISCRAPSEMYISVTVSDTYGAGTSSGYCYCHSGPLD